MMKIDIHDGTISFVRGAIFRALDRNAFMESELGKDAKTRLVNQNWWHASFAPEPGVTGYLIFDRDRLDSAYVLMEIPADARSEWSVDLELQRKALHDRWLQTELGEPPYEYSWGTVTSEFDAKGVVSEIIVNYER